MESYKRNNKRTFLPGVEKIQEQLSARSLERKSFLTKVKN